jgi:hypothetical protein
VKRYYVLRRTSCRRALGRRRRRRPAGSGRWRELGTEGRRSPPHRKRRGDARTRRCGTELVAEVQLPSGFELDPAVAGDTKRTGGPD